MFISNFKDFIQTFVLNCAYINLIFNAQILSFGQSSFRQNTSLFLEYFLEVSSFSNLTFLFGFAIREGSFDQNSSTRSCSSWILKFSRIFLQFHWNFPIFLKNIKQVYIFMGRRHEWWLLHWQMTLQSLHDYLVLKNLKCLRLYRRLCDGGDVLQDPCYLERNRGTHDWEH